MKIAVVGSRAFRNKLLVDTGMEHIAKKYPKAVIITGGAAGVDTWVEHAAYRLGLTVEVYPADWQKYGNRAGAVRNREMVKAADVILAFWDGSSKGTKITIDMATNVGKPLKVFQP